MQSDDGSRRSGSAKLLRILGLAVLVGLLGGLLFSLRDTARAVFLSPEAARHTSYRDMLRLGLHSATCYVAAGCGLMALVGLCLASLSLSGRQRALDAHAVPVLAAALAFIAVSAALLSHHGFLGSSLWAKRAYAMVEVGLIALFAAVGLGAAVHLGIQKAGSRRVLAGLLAALAAAFLLTNWGLWLYLAVLPELGSRGGLLAYSSAAAAVALVGVGVYLLLAPPPAEQRPGRRRVLGVLLLVVCSTVWASAHVLLPPRARRALLPGGAEPSPPLAKTPNVLWIVMDTARADALSCYGYRRETTPNIDALAAEGVLYQRAIAAAPWTLPSHASMFTGLLPSKHQCTAEHQFLDDHFTTIAEVLAEHGYATLAYSNNLYASGRHNLAQGFSRFEAFLFGRTWRRELLAGQVKDSVRLADYGAAETVEVVARWMSHAASRGRPFFLFVNFMEPHAAYGSTPLAHHWLDDGFNVRQAHATTRDLDLFAAGAFELTEDDFALLRALYDGDITYLDGSVGRLVDSLRTLGILDNTLVIITSDHGEHFGEHGLLGHRFSVYDELIRVPLIIRYPPAFKPGTRHGSLVRLIDLFPTILDVTGIHWEGRSQLQGRSLLDRANAPEEPVAVSEYATPLHVLPAVIKGRYAYGTTPVLRRLKCIYAADWKYIWASDGRHELYNIRADPGEKKNLIPEVPEKARELHQMLEARVGRSLPFSPIRPNARRSKTALGRSLP